MPSRTAVEGATKVPNPAFADFRGPVRGVDPNHINTGFEEFVHAGRSIP